MTPTENAIAWAKYQQQRHEEMKREGFVLEQLDAEWEEPEWSREADEAAYRRGFRHAVAYVSEMIDRLYKNGGFSRATEIANIMDSWNTEVVYPWSYRVQEDVKNGGRAIYGHPPLIQESWWSIRRRIIERDGRECMECGSRINLQADHILSVAKGGLPTDENLQTLCKRCNSLKGKD